ncbi:hypothetical protein [Neisseria elongata]|uniref:hypothetical protein n=1 Tax=Neisseria elongata TaxID=495 RepID=UPI0024B23332|nr:hypothetical protein [Neisseria elongata]
MIKYPISIFEIKEFLATALNYPFDKILVVSSGENADPEIAAEELDKLCCLCIGTQVEGDAAWLLNLYRIEATDDEIEKRIIAASQTKQIACYVPNDNWNGYLLTGSSPAPIQVYEDEEVAGENKYIFTNAI